MNSLQYILRYNMNQLIVAAVAVLVCFFGPCAANAAWWDSTPSTVKTAVGTHNTATDSHQDVRTLIVNTGTAAVAAAASDATTKAGTAETNAKNASQPRITPPVENGLLVSMDTTGGVSHISVPTPTAVNAIGSSTILLHMDNNLTDSVSGLTITKSGSLNYVTDPVKFTAGVQSYGTSNNPFLTTSTVTNCVIAGTDFSYDFWLHSTGGSIPRFEIFNGGTIYGMVELKGAGGLVIVTDKNNNVRTAPSISFPSSTWTHLAVTKINDTLIVYKNARVAAVVSLVSKNAFDTAATAGIRLMSNDGSYRATVDEFRYVNGGAYAPLQTPIAAYSDNTGTLTADAFAAMSAARAWSDAKAGGVNAANLLWLGSAQNWLSTDSSVAANLEGMDDALGNKVTNTLANGLQITYTGTLTGAVPFASVYQFGLVPTSSDGGVLTTTVTNLMGISGFSVSENSYATSSGLTTLSLDNVQYSENNISIAAYKLTVFSAPELIYLRNSLSFSMFTSPSLLTQINVPKLKYANGVSISISTCAGITSLAFPELEEVGLSGITVSGVPACTTVSLPKLKRVMGTTFQFSATSMQAMSFPELVETNAPITTNTLPVCTTMSFPKLKWIGGNLGPAGMNSCTTLYFPELEVIYGTFGIGTYAALTTLDFPKLKSTGSNLGVSSMANLTTINFPALVSVPGLIEFYTSLGKLENVTWGTPGITKSMGGNCNMQNQKLTQASVDNVLATYASLDGTNGTTSYGTGRTINLNGGTNATPSAAGLANKAIIQARGATVNTN